MSLQRFSVMQLPQIKAVKAHAEMLSVEQSANRPRNSFLKGKEHFSLYLLFWAGSDGWTNKAQPVEAHRQNYDYNLFSLPIIALLFRQNYEYYV